jgi:hypothetical protein
MTIAGEPPELFGRFLARTRLAQHRAVVELQRLIGPEH